MQKEIAIKQTNKIFNRDFLTRKEFENEFIAKLQQSEDEIENGEGIDSDIFFMELRKKYDY